MNNKTDMEIMQENDFESRLDRLGKHLTNDHPIHPKDLHDLAINVSKEVCQFTRLMEISILQDQTRENQNRLLNILSQLISMHSKLTTVLKNLSNVKN